MNPVVETGLSCHRLEPLRRTVGLHRLPVSVCKHRAVEIILTFLVHSFESSEGVSHDRNPAFPVALRGEAVSVSDVNTAVLKVDICPPERHELPASETGPHGNNDHIPKPLEIRCPAHRIIRGLHVVLDCNTETVHVFSLNPRCFLLLLLRFRKSSKKALHVSIACRAYPRHARTSSASRCG